MSGNGLPKDRLHQLRHIEGLTEREIADEMGSTRDKVHYWLNKYGIKHPRDELDAETLRDLYLDKGLNIPDIAERYQTSEEPVRRRMIEYGIERRETAESKQVNRASFGHDDRGYERWTATNGKYEKDRFRVHRLAAIAWFGIEEVAGNVVHHKNEIKWDNREANLEVMGAGEHTSLHAKRRAR